MMVDTDREARRTLLQGFEWHTSSEPPSPQETHAATSHYARLTRLIPSLASLGITDLWLPPGCKANNSNGNGYDCYDLWDLGEFDQKWARSTKWGSKEELDDLIRVAHSCDLKLIWDAVINHKTAGDEVEQCWAVEVDPNDRRYEIARPQQIQAWLQYHFPARGDTRSSMKWRAEHFNGTDWDQSRQKHALFKLIDQPTIKSAYEPIPGRAKKSMLRQRIFGVQQSPQRRPGKGWADDVDDMLGNHDYLLFSNIDFSHPEVRQDIFAWARWMLLEIGIDGFRLDAALHMSRGFVKDLLATLTEATGHHVFVVGEIWSSELHRILIWLDAVEHNAFAFDVPLLMSFSRLSQDLDHDNKTIDLRKLIQGSLVECRPHAAVTLVGNHDTQAGQSSFTPMSDLTKILAYAFVLLRREGTPCVFWGDLFGTQGPQAQDPACSQGGRTVLADLILARSLFAHGRQQDVFDDPRCIAWTRAGTSQRSGCVVMLNIYPRTMTCTKNISAGRVGQTWIDLLGETNQYRVKIDEAGLGAFRCKGNSAAVYVSSDDSSINRFPVQLGQL